MNELLLFAKAFVFCSFAVLFIHIIAPKGSTEKILSLVLIAFTLLSVVEPIKNIKSLTPDSNEYISQADYSNELNGNQLIKTGIRILTDEALNSIGIDNYELVINVSDAENDTVVIEEFKIYVNETNEKDKIISAVKSKTGFEPEIFEMDGTNE